MIPHSRPTVVPGCVEAVSEVIESGQHAGQRVRRAFERELATRVGVRHGIAVQSGSAALHVALLAIGTAPGDPVVLPSYACMALLNAVTACGARPILADVDPSTLNPTLESYRVAIDRAGLDPAAIRALIVPHMIGSPAPIPAIRDLGVPVIEDCALALGAELQGEEVGAWGDVSTFSFYATKVLSTGQGGMVLTASDAIAAEARNLIQYDNRETWTGTSWNYPMPDLSAALGRAQLPHLDAFLQRRRLIATHYDDFARRHGLETVAFLPDAAPNHFRFVLLLENREAIRRQLESENIEAKSPVFRPLHRYTRKPSSDFTGADAAQDRALSLPIYPSLSDDDLERVINILEQCV